MQAGIGSSVVVAAQTSGGFPDSKRKTLKVDEPFLMPIPRYSTNRCAESEIERASAGRLA